MSKGEQEFKGGPEIQEWWASIHRAVEPCTWDGIDFGKFLPLVVAASQAGATVGFGVDRRSGGLRINVFYKGRGQDFVGADQATMEAHARELLGFFRAENKSK